jgi:hypothetical protein
MRKALYIIIPLLLMGYLIVILELPRTRPEKFEAGNKVLYARNLESKNRSSENKNQNEENKNQNISSDHSKQPFNCKTCHACEYPTKEDPCLIECPREEMVSASYRTSEEGPEVVVIDEMSDYYSGVVFSHKMHSQMSEISNGCTGCHHYNTIGPVLNCRKCHQSTREREDVSIPDLKAAFHRQCMTCHKQWSGENGCNTQCHERKGPDNEARIQKLVKEFTGKTHPLRPKPSKMIWETNYGEGKIVTFYHDEHVELFKLNCSDCHSGDNCTKCHASKTQEDFSKIIKIKKSPEEHHKPCNNCHYKDACGKCHRDSERKPFDHASAGGWSLKWYHSRLACSRCHGSSIPFKKPDNNCTSCHKNFILGKFDHKVTGLVLSENHKDFECNNCHLNNDFAKKPDCSTCHDDKSFPKDSPGKKVRR